MRYRIIGADKETGDDVEMVVSATSVLSAAEIGSAKGIFVSDVVKLEDATMLAQASPPAALAPDSGLDFLPAAQPANVGLALLDPVLPETPEWHYADGPQQVGPLTESQIRSLLQGGRFTSATMVWKVGMAQWIPLAQAGLGMLPEPRLRAPTGPMQFPSARSVQTDAEPERRYHHGPVRNGPLRAGIAGGDPSSEMSNGPAYTSNRFAWYFKWCFRWYLWVLAKYADFQGRASRTEFWCYWLIAVAVSVLCSLFDGVLGTQITHDVEGKQVVIAGILGTIVGLATLLPGLAVQVRRLHDIGRSGWWWWIILIPLIGVIVLVIFWCDDSESFENQYGPNPKEGWQ